MERRRTEPTASFDTTGLTRVAGFVDLQVNGGFGHDFTHDPSTIWAVAEELPKTGVTAFLPTIITSPPEVRDEALAVLTSGPPCGFTGATPIGLHLEGPMITIPGAHPPAFVETTASPGGLSREDGVAMVTLAPELPGAINTIVELVARGILVSLGHSRASYSEARAAADAGATLGTHLFNAMGGVTARHPGLAGFLLTDPRMRFGLIADDVHVHPASVRLAHEAAGERLVLITDATAATGRGSGAFDLGDRTVVAMGGVIRNEEGALAGSVLTMDVAVRNLMAATGCSLERAAAAASTIPTSALGLSERDDAVFLDDGGNVVATVVDGRLAFLAETHRLRS